ncbi:hypothetical protein F4808DRAFT_362510 [Astrocystis sublimbata]|nr:hypothetical protein F4808DRAFT_362510 [Astrocystis sublimbata]
MQLPTILYALLATIAPAALATPLQRACQSCDLDCPRVIGNSIGVPQFCAIVNDKPLCVQSPPCGGFGGGIGGGVSCPTGFKCVADDVLGGTSRMCVPL